jgi:hypothetical protein
MHKEFELLMLSEAGMEKARAISAAFDTCLKSLLEISPKPSREMSIVRTKLEEAYFYAKKAMALKVENNLSPLPAEWPR